MTTQIEAPIIMEELAGELHTLVAKYSGRITIAEAVGALEVVKMEVFQEQFRIVQEGQGKEEK